MKARITGTGRYLPERIMTNNDMAKLVDTSDEWISSRTGIRQRHLSDQGTVMMACEAAKNALADARITIEQIDLILVATVSPDHLFPSVSCELQAALGAAGIPCMDLSAACTGFLFAMNTAAAYIQAGIYERILVVGAETLSRFVNWEERSTCVLFGDGAGAAVFTADEEGIFAIDMGSDGRQGMVLYCEGKPIINPIVHRESDGEKLHMDGQAVYKFAVRQIPKTVRKVLDNAQMDISEVDHFIMHQANVRIIMAAAKKLGIPMEKIPINIDQVGNLAAASIPILLDEYNKSGKIRRGDRLVITGFGGGLTWGSAAMVW